MTRDIRPVLREALRDWLAGKAYATNAGFYVSDGGGRAPWSRDIWTFLGPQRFLAVASWLHAGGFGVPDDLEMIGEVVMAALASQAARKARALAQELAELERLQIKLGVLSWPVAFFVEEADRLARAMDRQVGITLDLLKSLSKGGTPADGPPGSASSA